jgi:molecular chaperone DnaK
MVDEARQNEAADKQRLELIQARNNADSLAYQTEKTLGELGDKVPASERENIQSKVSELRKAAEGEDVEAIKRLSDEVQNAFHAISQQLYAQQGQAQQQASGMPGSDFPNYGQPGGNGKSTNGHGEEEGDVVEGEFREA